MVKSSLQSKCRGFAARRARAIAYTAHAGLVAIALLQISFASHQFEHIADDFSNVCRVCVQHERLDDIAAVAAAAEVRATPFAAPPTDFATVSLPATSSTYRSRAPPLP